MICRFQSPWALSRPVCLVAFVALFVLCFAVTRVQADDDYPGGKPVVGKSSDGQLIVFKVDAEGQLLYRWQKSSDGNWSSWSTLGNSFSPGIAVATNADGLMQVFAVNRATKGLEYARQETANSLNWTPWRNLGGAIRSPLAVGQNADGRLEIFALDATSGAIQHLWQTNAHGGWSAWASIGGNLEPGPIVAKNKDGRLELFGIEDTSGTLVHCWQRSANGSGDWSEWAILGGKISTGFAVGTNIVGRMEVFGVNTTNGAANRIIQKTPGDSKQWSDWLDFGGNLKALALGQSGDGRLEIFGVDAKNGMLLHRWETLTHGTDQWSDWASLGATSQTAPVVIANEDGDLEVFALDANNSGVINHRRQISAASDWLDWSSLDASTFQYASRTWQTDEGLPDNVVQAIAQTGDGYLWVGTRAGLARFDGVRFTPFDSKNTPEIKNSSITALCAGQEGSLWIGSDGGGVVRLKDGAFARLGKAEGLAGENVRVIYQSRDGSLWIGTSTGMSCYKDGKFTNYTESNGLLSDVVSFIHEDRDGNLWIATGKGLNRLRGGGTMDAFNMPNGLPNDSVRGICQDKGGRIWIGSNNGLLWYNWFWGKSFYAYNSRYGLSDTFVSAICEDREGNLWVGTYSGLNRFHEGRFYNQLDNEGLPFDRVNALFEDREGDLWVGSKEGLVRLTPKRFVAYTKQQGLTHNNVMSVLEDHRGSLWFGTWGGGLDQLKNEHIIAYAHTNVFSQDLVLSLCEGNDGSIWTGADFDGGLTQLKDGKTTHYTWKDGLLKTGLRVLHEDRNGLLWIGTSQGLNCLSKGHVVKSAVTEFLASYGVGEILEDHAGTLWLGTDQGLVAWQNGKFAHYTAKDGLRGNTVSALYEDRDHDLWIGTSSGGLSRYRSGKFTTYSELQGLFSDEIFAIVEDDDNWLWMSCSKGVFKVLKGDLDDFDRGRIKQVPCIAYGKIDGMESPQCNGLAKPSAWKTRDGRLWFATAKGVVAVNPKTIKADLIPPSIYIEQLFADKRPLILAREIGSSMAAALLRIPPSRGELEFRYTAPVLSAVEKTRFKYRLDGIDSDWVDADTRRVAYYNSVPPGTYHFQVIACNKDGVWNDTGASLAIVLMPHLWETWWFRILLVLIVIGAAAGAAVSVARHRMQRKLEVLRQRHAIEKERGRIAKDIHDDLGSSLTRIMMLGERVEEGLLRNEDIRAYVTKIVNSARHTVQALDEIVWAINPENDTLDGLLGYIGHYVDEFFENTNVSCRLEMPVELPSIPLPAEVRHNLFLVTKEAFNNVLKHSQATAVRVEVSVTDTTLQIVIEDNGRGFDLNDPKSRRGNGLENMRKRMENLGGRLEVATAEACGTKLKLEIELKQQRNRQS